MDDLVEIGTREEFAAPAFEKRTSTSNHALASAAIPQDTPRVITQYFDNISSLMNGSGEDPVNTSPMMQIGERRSDQTACVPQFRPGTVLRREHFGGIIFNSSANSLEFINRMAVDAVVTGGPLPGHIASALARFMTSANSQPIEIISFNDDLQDAFNYPISATLELTYSCHHACKHCMYNSSPTRDRSAELALDVWLAQIRKFRAHGLANLYLSGGEIIRFYGYEKILQACDDIGLSYLIVSDLCSHTDVDYQRLVDAKNLTRVMVSLDGASAEQHDFLRGRGAFESTVNGIKRLISLGIEVGIYHTTHRRNLSELEDFVSFCNDLGTKLIVTGVACNMGRAERTLIDSTLSDHECLTLTEKYIKFILAGKVTPLHGAWNTIAEKVGRGEPCPNVYCTWRDFAHAATHRVHLAPDGAVHMCPKLQNTGFDYFGNVNFDDLSVLWRSASVRRLRDKAMSENFITGVDVNSLR